MTAAIATWRHCLALVVLAAWAMPAIARAVIGNPAMDEAAATMRPGQFLLDDDRVAPGFPSMGFPTDGPITIGVSIALQRLYVYRGGALVAVSTISSGKRGKSTPLGDFTILQKRRWHRSNLYSNAPMPFMQRLTWDGIAIHAGHNPGYPASHGCIRLPPGFAQTLFGMTAMGDAVTVSEYPIHTPVMLDVAWDDLAWFGRPGDSAPPPVMRRDKTRDGPVWLEYDARIFAITSGR